jgi:hypothetical protein
MTSATLEQGAIENAWFAARYQTLPPAVEAQLRLAGEAYADDARAEAHLAQAREAAPQHPVVQVAAYRYHFYKGQLARALEVAGECLTSVGRELGLAPSWRDVQRTDADFSGDDQAVRFYLFSLKAYAYLLLRLNRLEEGRLAVDTLLALDAGNQVGGRVLLDVLERLGQDDED